jgi:cytochrome c551/c552
MQGENMKRAALAFALAAAAAVPAYAQEELAKKHNCFACHAVDKKLVGPAYKDVAAKYRNDPSAEARAGGVGTSTDAAQFPSARCRHQVARKVGAIAKVAR